MTPPNMRCALDQFVNWHLLPQWLYLHGEFYFSEDASAATVRHRAGFGRRGHG
jgi:glutaredoxin-related protein